MIPTYSAINQLISRPPPLPPCRHGQSVQWYEQLRGFSLINTIVTSAATFLPTSTSTNPAPGSLLPPSCFCNTTWDNTHLEQMQGLESGLFENQCIYIYMEDGKHLLLFKFVTLAQDWDRMTGRRLRMIEIFRMDNGWEPWNNVDIGEGGMSWMDFVFVQHSLSWWPPAVSVR